MKTFLILIVLSVVLAFGAFSVSGDIEVDRDPAAFYANCIDKKITGCDCKGGMWNSRSSVMDSMSQSSTKSCRPMSIGISAGGELR